MPKPVSFFARRSRKFELRSGRSSTDAEWLKQSQIVVDRVHIPHTDSNKISVKPGTRLGLLAGPGTRQPVSAHLTGGSKKPNDRFA